MFGVTTSVFLLIVSVTVPSGLVTVVVPSVYVVCVPSLSVNVMSFILSSSFLPSSLVSVIVTISTSVMVPSPATTGTPSSIMVSKVVTYSFCSSVDNSGV
jgi:hypothetical protein